jgi:hypothetical protein
MANRYFTQFFYTPHKMPVLLDCNVVIGSTGAVGTIKGPGIAGVTRLSAGVYQIKLQDNYNRYFMGSWGFVAPTTGSTVNDGSFVTGTTYVITAVGTTTAAEWLAAGVPAGITPDVGVVFKAASAGAAGTGTVKALGSSGIFALEVLGNTNLMLGPSGAANQGGLVTIKCLNASGAATDPAAGSVMGLTFYLSNSSVTVQGE